MQIQKPALQENRSSNSMELLLAYTGGETSLYFYVQMRITEPFDHRSREGSPLMQFCSLPAYRKTPSTLPQQRTPTSTHPHSPALAPCQKLSYPIPVSVVPLCSLQLLCRREVLEHSSWGSQKIWVHIRIQALYSVFSICNSDLIWSPRVTEPSLPSSLFPASS